MRRRLLVLAGGVVLALGIGGGVWVASGGKDATECKTVTYQAEDMMTPRVMEYHRVECGDERNPPGAVDAS